MPTASLAASGGSGGAGVAPPPQLLDARCLPAPGRACVDPHWAEPGGTLRLSGRYLASVTGIIFYGRPGPGDDAGAPASPLRSTSVTATVPREARNGPLAVVTSTGIRSRRWSGVVIDDPGQPPPLPKQIGSQPAIGTAVSTPHKIFYGGLQKPVFRYRIASSHPIDVTVSLIRVADGAAVRTWREPQVAPEATKRVIWDGTARGRVQREGYYSFQAVAATASAVGNPPSAAGDNDSFAFYNHIFPIRGKHEYGLGAGRFGAARRGHVHQGQDVLAACGTPLVAARAGKVSYAGYHSLAGYYVVIAGAGTGQDYVYMHLREPALVKTGDRIYTGQEIGEVGQTGDAQGCHLHFELWSAPGWYKGGRPFDPLPELQRWDRYS